MVDLRELDLDAFKDWVISVNEELTRQVGEPHGLNYEAGLDSALGQLGQGWYEDEVAIAACFKSIILNHPFRNANKRTAVAVMQYLKQPALTDNQVYDLTMKVATEGGGKIENNEIANLLYKTDFEVEHPHITELSNAPITPRWQELGDRNIWQELDDIDDN